MDSWKFYTVPNKSNEDPESPSKGMRFSRSIRMEKPPQTVVTVFPGEDTVDFKAQHNVTCFYEDHVHDWTWSKGWLTYGSRVVGPEDTVVIAVKGVRA